MFFPHFLFILRYMSLDLLSLGSAFSSSGVMAMQLSTLGQPRVFPPLSSVLSPVCCLCERCLSSGNCLKYYQSSASSVVLGVCFREHVQGSVWPSVRLHSDYMADDGFGSCPQSHAGCWADSWCLYFWCDRFLTHHGFSGDNSSRMLVACSLVSLSASRFQSCRSIFLSPWSCMQAP